MSLKNPSTELGSLKVARLCRHGPSRDGRLSPGKLSPMGLIVLNLPNVIMRATGDLAGSKPPGPKRTRHHGFLYGRDVGFGPRLIEGIMPKDEPEFIAFRDFDGRMKQVSRADIINSWDLGRELRLEIRGRPLVEVLSEVSGDIWLMRLNLDNRTVCMVPQADEIWILRVHPLAAGRRKGDAGAERGRRGMPRRHINEDIA